MVMVLGELGLSRLGDIPGLTATGAAAILAETGDPRRYDSSSSLVKHAGLSPSENASGAFEGQAHISRRGRPGLRLTAWRAVWPMLQFNPVMAAKYAAMTQAAEPPRLMQGRSKPGRQQPRPARGAPRPASRAPRPCCAGSTPWSSTAPAGTPRSPPAPAAASRRQPDQRIHPPAPLRVPLTFLPDEGESEPACTLRTSPGLNPGQLSPGRPELLTSSVERCRGRPGRLRGPRRARLHYVEREDPGSGHPNRAGDVTVLPGAALRHARGHAVRRGQLRNPGALAPAVARTPYHKPVRNGSRPLSVELDNFFLRWFGSGISVRAGCVPGWSRVQGWLPGRRGCSGQQGVFSVPWSG